MTFAGFILSGFLVSCAAASPPVADPLDLEAGSQAMGFQMCGWFVLTVRAVCFRLCIVVVLL